MVTTAIGRRPDKFQDTRLRNGKSFTTALDNQSGNDGERKRNLDGEGRPFPFFRSECNRPSDFLDVGADDVHTNTPAGDVCYFLRRRKTCPHNEVLDLLLAHAFKFSFACQSVFNNLFLDLFTIQAAAIISNLDDDMATFMEGLKNNLASFIFAVCNTVCRHLQTMISRVAYHVGQRILDQFQHLPIKFSFGTTHNQIYFLIKVLAQIADNTWQFGPGIPDWLHAGFHKPFLQLRRHMT